MDARSHWRRMMLLSLAAALCAFVNCVVAYQVYCSHLRAAVSSESSSKIPITFEYNDREREAAEWAKIISDINEASSIVGSFQHFTDRQLNRCMRQAAINVDARWAQSFAEGWPSAGLVGELRLSIKYDSVGYYQDLVDWAIAGEKICQQRKKGKTK